jgi:long-chain acyl-CoA synthetase
MNGVRSSSPLKRWLFETAYEAKKKALSEGRTTPIWDKLVFSKIHTKIFGGRIEVITSGSAPLSTQVHEFLRM